LHNRLLRGTPAFGPWVRHLLWVNPTVVHVVLHAQTCVSLIAKGASLSPQQPSSTKKPNQGHCQHDRLGKKRRKSQAYRMGVSGGIYSHPLSHFTFLQSLTFAVDNMDLNMDTNNDPSDSTKRRKSQAYRMGVSGGIYSHPLSHFTFCKI
jgi:hypothetical protein